MSSRKNELSCPCGRPLTYAACCGRYHTGLSHGVDAPDAESLMRSRYAAYVMQREDYLLATWHASTRPDHLDLRAPPVPKWLGLEIRMVESDGDQATVEFVARCRMDGRAQRLIERSRFLREAGHWFYIRAEE